MSRSRKRGAKNGCPSLFRLLLRCTFLRASTWFLNTSISPMTDLLHVRADADDGASEPPVWMVAHTAVYHIDRLWETAVRALWPFRDMGEADGVYVLYHCFLGYLRHFLSLAKIGMKADEQTASSPNLQAVGSTEAGIVSLGAPAITTEETAERIAQGTTSSFEELMLLLHAAPASEGREVLRHIITDLERFAQTLGGSGLRLEFGDARTGTTEESSTSVLPGEKMIQQTTDVLRNHLVDGNNNPPAEQQQPLQLRQFLQVQLERIQNLLNYFLMQVFAKRSTTQGTVLGWSRSLLNPGRSLADPQRLSFFATFLRSELRTPMLYNPLLPECYETKLVPQAQPAFDLLRFLREEIGDHKLSHQFIAIRPEQLDADPEVGGILRQALEDYFGKAELHAVVSADKEEAQCPKLGTNRASSVAGTNQPPSEGLALFNDPGGVDRAISAASLLIDFSRCLQADSRFSGTVERVAPYSRSKYVEQISGPETAVPLLLKANCSVFDAFPTTTPDLLFLHPRAGNAGYLVPRIFSRRMGPTQPFPKLLIVPFNPNFGPTEVRRPWFLKKQMKTLDVLWENNSNAAGAAVGEVVQTQHADDAPDPLTEVTSETVAVNTDREEVEVRLHWHRAREREIWETQWSLAAVVGLLKKRYTLVRVVFGFAVFQLTSLLSEKQRQTLSAAADNWRASDADFAGVAKKALFAFGRTETVPERLWREGWYCHPLSYRLLDGYFVRWPATAAAIDAAGAPAVDSPRRAAHPIQPDQIPLPLRKTTGAPREHIFGPRPALASDTSTIVSTTTVTTIPPSFAKLLAESPSADEPLVVEFPERPGFAYILGRSGRGQCHEQLGLCECFPPFFGLLCEHKDHVRAAVDVVYATTTPVHNLQELLDFPLKTLKNISPKVFDTIPLVVFHDAPLSGEHKQAIVKGALPIRVWFAYLDDWTSAVPQHDLSRSEASLGYRHQCRWKSGPLFHEPALKNYNFLFFFDTDSHFPKIELADGGASAGDLTPSSFADDYLSNTIEQMREEQHVYAYVHRTREKDSMVAYLWDYTKLYLADKDKQPPSEDLDHVSLFNELPDMHHQLFASSAEFRESVVGKIFDESRTTATTPKTANRDEEGTTKTTTALLQSREFVETHVGLDLQAKIAEHDLESFLRNNTFLYRWNRHVYMTDFEIMYMPWFRDPKIYDYFHYVDSLHGWYTDRWGDHAFRTMQLKIFLDDKWNGSAPGVLELKDFPYAHQRFCTCGRFALTCDQEKRCRVSESSLLGGSAVASSYNYVSGRRTERSLD
ncbi:unnamed protein product [Amoebophrya sp. A120]|nr:unnamed protein product [Amoebophrya sp. A120]|eukprot:GSA120T00005259001.1